MLTWILPWAVVFFYSHQTFQIYGEVKWLVAAVLLTLGVGIRPPSSQPPHLPTLFFAALVLWSALSLFWSHNTVEAIRQTSYFFWGFVAYLLAMGNGQWAIAKNQKNHCLLPIAYCLSLLGTALALYDIFLNGFWNPVAPREIHSLTLGHPVMTAQILVATVPVTLGLAISLLPLREKVRMRGPKFLFCSLSAILQIGLLLMTMTRGAWVAAAAGLTLVLIHFLSSRARHSEGTAPSPRARHIPSGGREISREGCAEHPLREIPRSLIGWALPRNDKWILILVSLLAVSVLAPFFLSSPLRTRALSILQTAPYSNHIRLKIWNSSLHMTQNRPLHGHGAGQFFIQYPRFRTPEEQRITLENIRFETAHSDYIQLATELGVAGLLLWLGTLLLILRRKPDPGEPLAWGLYAACIGMAIHGFFSTQITLAPAWILFCLLLGSYLRISPSPESSPPKGARYCSLALILTALFFLIFQTRLTLSDYHLKQGNFDRSIRENPANAHALFRKAVLFQNQNQWEEAKALYQRIHALQPYEVSSQINLSALLMRQGDAAGALAIAEFLHQHFPYKFGVNTNRDILLSRSPRVREGLEDFDRLNREVPWIRYEFLQGYEIMSRIAETQRYHFSPAAEAVIDLGRIVNLRHSRRDPEGKLLLQSLGKRLALSPALYPADVLAQYDQELLRWQLSESDFTGAERTLGHLRSVGKTAYWKAMASFFSGEIHRQQKNWEAAIRDYLHVFDFETTFQSLEGDNVYNAIAECFTALHQTDRAARFKRYAAWLYPSRY